MGIVGAKFNRLFLGKCITDKEAVRKVSNQWDVMSPSKPASTGESSVAAAKVAPGPRCLQGPMKIVIMGHDLFPVLTKRFCCCQKSSAVKINALMTR